jgi:hypothetical protein
LITARRSEVAALTGIDSIRKRQRQKSPEPRKC